MAGACASRGCPYKKIYYNWQSGKAEKCIFCYPRIEAGQPTVCSETCVGRIRYLGVLLYDADRIQEAASVERDRDLYQAQLDIFLDPNDPDVIKQAASTASRTAGWTPHATAPSTRWRCNGRWPCRCTPSTARCPWSGMCRRSRPSRPPANAGHVGVNGEIPDVSQLRIPVQYLANLLTAGDTGPVVRALERMLAMRTYQRDKHVEQRQNLTVLKQAGLSMAEVEEMYHVMAIANYEDRFVIPSAHREYAENAFDIRGGCGFSFGNGCSDGASEVSMFGGKKPARSRSRPRSDLHTGRNHHVQEEPDLCAPDPARPGLPAELPRCAVAQCDAAAHRRTARPSRPSPLERAGPS